jgi:hypothetical protein
LNTAPAFGPNVRGWWEFGKSSASFADVVVEQPGG